MEIYRPLRGALFVYELLRLAALIGLFTILAPQEGAGGASPYLVYMTANGLYPLMALFLWRDMNHYRHYLPLYGAGKALGVFCFYIWGFFMLKSIFEAAGEGSPTFMLPVRRFMDLLRLGGSFLISLGDLFSLLGCWILYSKQRQAGTSAGGEV
ncbi:MAG: hypothetical protein LBL43_00210 [Treponema sp.]|jgi:hypothetical protein|nr:hypothetical protein [Treponema sp.]